MMHIRIVMLLALGLWMLAGSHEAKAGTPLPLTPKAAQQYAADSDKAAQGDSDAAYRMGEALESGRFGLKDPRKALTYYRLAAKNGHPQAAKRITEIESQLAATTPSETSPISRDTKR
jgi:TPR repeat protein